MEKQSTERHLRHITAAKHLPALAGDPQVCGRSIITGQVKCVPEGSPKAGLIEDIPVE